MKKINRKIPGILPAPPKNEIDGKITDLTSKTIPELIELRERQHKLLKNTGFISKLPDKGEKIRAFYNKILECLKNKESEEQTCYLLNNLTLNGVDKQAMQNVEWEGKVAKNSETYLDSDDDSDPEDVLEILSKSTAQERKVKVLQPEPTLITPEDLRNIKETPHIKYLVDKSENQVHPKAPTGQFKPYKTTKTDVHNPENEILRKRSQHWEVTAATPPPSIHGPAKLLPLDESLKLQKDYNCHLKEVEAQHAAEKLLARTGIKMASLPVDTTRFGAYRDMERDSDEESQGSDKEVFDEEPERGGVVFTVTN